MKYTYSQIKILLPKYWTEIWRKMYKKNWYMYKIAVSLFGAAYAANRAA